MAKGNKKRVAGLVALILVVAAAGGLDAFLYANTLVDLWIPLSVSVVAAAILWFPLRGAWHKRLHTESLWGPLAAHSAAVVFAGFTILLAANYFGADDSTIHREEATVVSKESHKRHHSRRVGRRRYTTGQPYYVYDLNLRFAGGRTKSMRVDAQRYNRTRTGSTIILPMEKGLLGWPVIMRSMPDVEPGNSGK